MSRISLSPKTALLKDYAILLLAGLAALLFAVRLGFSEVAWSDEAAYTVVARNLAEHGSLLTTLYPPETILRGGYPQRDVHLPGFMLLLALPASVFGPTAAALLLPARLAFLLSGLLMFWAGRRLFSPMVGYASALAFWSFPLFFAYANTVMAELPLVFVSLACFAVWLAARQRPRLPLLAALAVLLAAGTLVRETFVVFLPAALAVVRRWPQDGRRRAGLFFAAGLVLLAGVVCLLSLHRSYYPNTFNEILARGDWRLVAAGFGDNFVLQASRYASRPENFPQDILRLLFPALVAAGAAAFARFGGARRAAAGYFLFAGIGLWLFLSIFYTSNGWRGLRSLMMVLPPGLILLNGLLARVRPRWAAIALFGVELAVFAAFSVQTSAALSADRSGAYRREESQAQAVAAALDGYRPQVVLANGGWRYALNRFPTTVIWRLPDSPAQLRQLRQAVTIDAVALDDPAQRDRLLEAAPAGASGGGFRPAIPPAAGGYFFLVRGDLFKQPIHTTLGPDLLLLGVDAVPAAPAGGPLLLTLVWQAQTDIAADYALAVRLLNAGGEEAQYWLGRPALSSRPTPGWRAGDVVPDTWDITLDPGLPPGPYRLEVEAYQTPAGQSAGKATLGQIHIEGARDSTDGQ